MKTTLKMFVIVALTVVMAVIAGCSSQKFTKVGDTIAVGDKKYDLLMGERVNLIGGNAVTLNLVESDAVPKGCPVGQPAPLLRQPSEEPVIYRTNTHTAVNTRVVNSNNQGSKGLVNGAFEGAVGKAALGAGIALAGWFIGPIEIAGSSAAATSTAVVR